MKSTICVTLLICISFTAFSQQNDFSGFSGQVKFESSAATGTITVTSEGFGKKRMNATSDAAASAIYVILFKGVPSSQYELPMIADEAKINNPAVQNLLSNGYGSFVTETILLNEQKQTRKIDGAKGFNDLFKLTINCDALRRYLEQNHVIRKFGI